MKWFVASIARVVGSFGVEPGPIGAGLDTGGGDEEDMGSTSDSCCEYPPRFEIGVDDCGFNRVSMFFDRQSKN